MKTLKYVFAAGETKSINTPFLYFRVLQGQNLNFEFFSSSGSKNGEIAQVVGAGYWEVFDVMCTRLDITSTINQTVQIAVSANKGGYDPTTVTLTSDTLNPVFTSVVNTVVTQNKPLEYLASYKSNTALAANTPETVFTPAANLNGAVINRMEFASWNSGGAASFYQAFIIKSSAPSSVIDGDIVAMANHYFNTGTVVIISGKSEQQIKIPAGKGLYFISGIAETNALRSVLYTLL